MRILLSAALLVLSPLPATAAAPAMQPGLYEITGQMAMKGLPMQMPAFTFQHCITPQDISYDFACVMQDHGSMVGRASGSSRATGYDMQMNGRFVPAMAGMSEFSQKMSAKRLGACK